MATTAKFWMHQFIDDTGQPYAGVKVYHYVSGTSTDKDAWVDAGKTSTANQPVQGDSRGVVSFYGDGVYRLRVTDNDGIQLYDWQDVDIIGRTTGIATRIPFFDANGNLTSDDDLTWDTINRRIAAGTHSNITERIVLPTNSFLGAERSVASAGEGAQKIIGLNASDHVALDPGGLGIDLNPLVSKSLLYIDGNGILRVFPLTNGQIPIGSTGAIPVAAQLAGTNGITITNGAGTISIGVTTTTATAIQAADQTVNNSATLVDITKLFFPMVASTSYAFEALLLLNAASTTPNFKFFWSLPALATAFWGPMGSVASTGGFATQYWLPGAFDGNGPTVLLTEASTLAIRSNNGTTGLMIWGIIRNGANAGNAQLQYAQNTANASDSKVLKDSFIISRTLQV